MPIPCGFTGGLANGFGGPVAPADNSAEADGEGGGKTMDPCRLCVWVGVSAGLRGELDSPVTALPPCSEPPSGICTVSFGPRGLADKGPPVTLFVRDGGAKATSGSETFRDLSMELCERGSGGEVRIGAPPSTDWERLVGSSLIVDSSVLNSLECCPRIDRFSSTGVKMLCDLR